jgi:hypothetical protein
MMVPIDTTVVHLVNDPSWARFFRPASHEVWSYCVPAWSARGLLIHLGLWVKRIWGKTASATEGANASAHESSDTDRLADESMKS